MFPTQTGAIDVLSCDVFDTLLRRDAGSELSRFARISALAARRLEAEHGVAVAPAALLRARREVQRLAYRALDLTDPTGEVRHREMLDAMAALLDLGPRGASVLEEAETEIELASLTPNRPLLAWLAGQARAGKRIVAVSDTWLSSATIWRLLDRLAPDHPVSAVHTSADHGATKRSGALFREVLRREAVGADRVLHCGDDAHADIRMAKASGLRCWQARRGSGVRVARALDALRFRVLHPVPLH